MLDLPAEGSYKLLVLVRRPVPAAVKALHRRVRNSLPRDGAPSSAARAHPAAAAAAADAAWTAYPGALLPPAPPDLREAIRSIIVVSPGCGEIVSAWVFLHAVRPPRPAPYTRPSIPPPILPSQLPLLLL